MADRLRIAVGTGTFPCLSETFVLQQIVALLDLGHDVQVFAERRPPPQEPVQPEVARRGLDLRTCYLDMPSDAEAELPVWPPWGRSWAPGAADPVVNARRLLGAVPELVRAGGTAPRATAQALDPRRGGYRARSLSSLYRLSALCRIRPPVDVVHVHFGPVADNVRFVRRLWSAPLVVSFHGYDFSTWPRQHGADVYAALFREADVITVGSAHAWRRLVDLGAPDHRLRLLPVGLSPAAFPFRARRPEPDGRVRLLSVARLVPKKGIASALHAVALLAPSYPGLRYDVVGDGPEAGALRGLARDLGIADRVTFHGAAVAPEVRRHLDRAHVFVLPSTGAHGDEEGQGLVLQEAQASGLPVVVTDHGPLREGFLPGRSGVLVAPDHPPALAAGIRRLVDTPGSWPEMGRCGRRFVESSYDARVLAGRLVALYREAIAGGRRT
jgi:colanic acid/amylovoran biosynthesis glycosyltransferase